MSDMNLQEQQPKDPVELLRVVRPLTDERRIEARERAKALVIRAAGVMPDRKDFDQHTTSKYPEWMNQTINVLCLIVLVAAFLPSAMRLFYIGSTTFVATLRDAHAAMLAGYSIVIMAEISMVLFSIASVIVEPHKSESVPATGRGAALVNIIRGIDKVQLLLIVSQFVATAIALVGNAQVSLAHGHEENPFAVIEAFSPSIVVFTTSYILKAQMLSSIERRHANTRAYGLALAAWKAATSRPEDDARFRPALHNALRDFLREDNSKGTGATARRDYIAGLVLDDWRQLVKRELLADEWYEDPSAVGPTVQTDTRQAQTSRQRVGVSARQTPRQPDTARQPTDSPTVSAPTDSQTTDDDTQPTQAVGGLKTSQEVVDWLDANPDKLGLSLRAIAAETGAGKDTVASAKKMILKRQEQQTE